MWKEEPGVEWRMCVVLTACWCGEDSGWQSSQYVHVHAVLTVPRVPIQQTSAECGPARKLRHGTRRKYCSLVFSNGKGRGEAG